MAHIEHEDAVDPVDRLVLGDDQPTDIPLKLRAGVGRKHRREKRGVVTHDFRSFDHRQHKNTSRGRTRPFRGGILLRFFSRKRNKSSRSCCKSRVLIRTTAKLWRKYHLTYDQARYIAKEVRKALGVKRITIRKRAIQRLSRDEEQ